MGCAPIPPIPPAGCWPFILGGLIVAGIFFTPIVSWLTG